jgi:hypothetical protein
MTNIIKLLKNTTIAAITVLSITGCNKPPEEANFKNLNPKTQTFVTQNMRKGVYPEAELTGQRMITFYVLEFADGNYFEGDNGVVVELLSYNDAEELRKLINGELYESGNTSVLIKNIKEMSGLRTVKIDQNKNIISIK